LSLDNLIFGGNSALEVAVAIIAMKEQEKNKNFILDESSAIIEWWSSINVRWQRESPMWLSRYFCTCWLNAWRPVTFVSSAYSCLGWDSSQ